MCILARGEQSVMGARLPQGLHQALAGTVRRYICRCHRDDGETEGDQDVRTPLEAAIKVAGTRYRLAKLLDVDTQLVDYWYSIGNPPAKWWPELERATGVKASRFFKHAMKGK